MLSAHPVLMEMPRSEQEEHQGSAPLQPGLTTLTGSYQGLPCEPGVAAPQCFQAARICGALDPGASLGEVRPKGELDKAIYPGGVCTHTHTHTYLYWHNETGKNASKYQE